MQQLRQLVGMARWHSPAQAGSWRVVAVVVSADQQADRVHTVRVCVSHAQVPHKDVRVWCQLQARGGC